MPMYDPNKLLADSQANSILTKDTNTVVLTVTECPEVAAGESGSWVTSFYAADSYTATFKVSKHRNMFHANQRFDDMLSTFRKRGYVFANEQWTDSFLGSNLSTEETSHDFTD